MNDPRGKLSYVLPLRWSGIRPVEAAELARYLQRLCDYGVVGEVIVVDGSPGPHPDQPDCHRRPRLSGW